MFSTVTFVLPTYNNICTIYDKGKINVPIQHRLPRCNNFFKNGVLPVTGIFFILATTPVAAPAPRPSVRPSVATRRDAARPAPRPAPLLRFVFVCQPSVRLRVLLLTPGLLDVLLNEERNDTYAS
jgi:hypothetical protein